MRLRSFANILYSLNVRGYLRFVPDKAWINFCYKKSFGRKPNWENPKSFTEKLQWMKLNYYNPLYTELVDKHLVKAHIAQRIGENYIIPTLGVWDRFDDIDFDSLPEQFVLKCTHDSGGLIVCRDKAKLDKKAAKRKIEKCLKRNFYWHRREWVYRDIKPRIIAEKYMEDSKTAELRDYKFFSFDGEVKALFIASERQTAGEETKFDFFDAEYNHLPFTNGHPNADQLPEKPVCFEKMKELASKLSEGIPQVRVDFYEVDGKIYFGELTFAHWSGMRPFDPEEWDYKFGEWFKLPPKNV